MKKLVKILLVIAILASSFTSVLAAPDYDDTAYWDDFCGGELDNNDDIRACNAYHMYQAEAADDRIDSIKDEIANAQDDLEAAQDLANEYREKIVELEESIAELNEQIEDLEEDIDALEEEIAKNEEEVDRLNEEVLDRMAAKQGSMHFDPFLEFLLGATSFEDMLRRSYGLNAIMEADEKTREEIEALIAKLDEDKKAIEEKKTAIENKRSQLESEKEEQNVMLEFQYKVQAETEELIANLRNQEDEAVKLKEAALDKIKGEIDQMPSSSGLTSPVPGASISAGMPYYPASFGGGIHLGVDYAVSFGTSIYAPANGVVIMTANGCPSYGYLGSSCGYQYGGVSAGGNQVLVIMAAGGSIYGMSLNHLKLNSIGVEEGEVFVQGQYLGQVGSSGNSTGPHCHIELFYLGEGDMSDIPDYINRGYSYSFNCGWGSSGLNRLCANGVGAPCRLDGRNYFGV